MDIKKIAFTGGGTGGHIYPALAVIGELRKKGFTGEIFWIGQADGPEYAVVTAAGIPFHAIKAGKLRRYFSLRNVTDLIKTARGYFNALSILKREKPDLLFCKGGFVSVPPALAAHKLHIPVYIHESDGELGLANRMCAPMAQKIFVSYQETIDAMREKYRSKAEISGNPVRESIYAGSRFRGRVSLKLQPGDALILALGGSGGAVQINRLVEAMAHRPEITKRAVVYHQTGANFFKPSRESRYLTTPYIKEEMADLIAASDVIISRAGAGAIWEFAALGATALFIPLRGHQTKNCLALESRGACAALYGDDATEENLTGAILELLNDESKRKKLGSAMKAVANLDSKAYLADKILEGASANKPPIG